MNWISEFFSDFKIKIKPENANKIIKWLTLLFTILIIIAFRIGSLRTKYLTKLDDIDENVTKNGQELVKTNQKVDSVVVELSKKIDNVYDDGIVAMKEYQTHTNEQLSLIIDFTKEKVNEDLLKKTLDLNSKTTERSMENYVNNLKENNQVEKEKRNFTIGVVNLKKNLTLEEVDEYRKIYDVIEITLAPNSKLYNIKYKDK